MYRSIVPTMHMSMCMSERMFVHKSIHMSMHMSAQRMVTALPDGPNNHFLGFFVCIVTFADVYRHVSGHGDRPGIAMCHRFEHSHRDDSIKYRAALYPCQTCRRRWPVGIVSQAGWCSRGWRCRTSRPASSPSLAPSATARSMRPPSCWINAAIHCWRMPRAVPVEVPVH